MPPRLLLTSLAMTLAASALQPCRVVIVDRENGWPVPLVELRTTHETRHVSDNAGLVAIDEPDLLGNEVWFGVHGHGYGVAKDGFGYEGVRLKLLPGGECRVEVERRILAKRLGRLTGGGLFAEAAKLGDPPVLPESGVFGCDSVQVAEHAEGLFWVWGDSLLPGHPLGIFHASAATTPRRPLARCEPPLALAFDYFRDPAGRPRAVAPMPGEGPTWLSGLVSWPGGPLAATYTKVRGYLDEYEAGLCVWDPRQKLFVPERIVWRKQDAGEKPVLLTGHAVRWRDPAGAPWILFGNPFPSARCPDDFDSWKSPEKWQRVLPPAPLRAADGAEITAHGGSIAWSAHRQRWVAVFTRKAPGPAPLGEVWYAESASPFGPWERAVMVLRHDNQTFYNPRLHPELAPADAPFLLFEGTYTTEFADHARPTPRYQYNQILYRLDFADLDGAASGR